MSVASPHFTDLESPLERKTFSVERAISDPVEPRLALCRLMFRDILPTKFIKTVILDTY